MIELADVHAMAKRVVDECKDPFYVHGDYFLVVQLATVQLERKIASISDPKCTILREMLACPKLKALLPAESIELLEFLFLPKGLNIRNLVWHGFLAPSDVSRDIAALLWHLSSQPNALFPVVLPAAVGSTWMPHDSTAHILSAAAATASMAQCESLPRLVSQLLRQDPMWLEERIDASDHIPDGRHDAVKQAVSAVRNRQELLFLFRILPVFEHSVRKRYCQVNPGEEELYVAQIDQYYSTLDGFGQMSKHQVLLNPIVRRTGRTNQLYEHLPLGLLHLLLDLFMMPNGVNVRARVSHGLVDCTRLTQPSDQLSLLVQFVLIAFLSLVLDDPEHSLGSCHSWICEYQSMFHPMRYSTQLVADCHNQLDALSSHLLEQFQYDVLPIAEAATTHVHVKFRTLKRQDALLIFREKATRFTPATNPLLNSVRQVSTQLERQQQQQQSRGSIEYCVKEPNRTEACFNAILKVCRDACIAFRQRLNTQRYAVEYGPASSSQRKALLNTLCFSDVFQSVLRWTVLSIEAHLSNTRQSLASKPSTKILSFIQSFCRCVLTSNRSYLVCCELAREFFT